MVPREDDRPTLIAQVDPSRCVSCGICAGSCAPMGVGPPGRSGRDQLAAVRSLVETWRAGAGPVVAIVCGEAPATLTQALHGRRAHVHSVPCAGGLHTSVIEFLVRAGAPGVVVFGCPARDCTGREGPKWLRERVFNAREAELQARVDRRRVRLTTAAPGDLAAAIAAYDAFVGDLALLERPEENGAAELDAACETARSDLAALR